MLILTQLKAYCCKSISNGITNNQKNMENINHLIFGFKNNLFRNKAVKQYREAIHNCTLPDDQLKELNWEKRKAIVTHAYNHTFFYRKYYDSAGFHPDALKTEADWEQVPALKKEMVRFHREEMKADNIAFKYFGTATTGGSTGIPLMIYTDKRFPIEILGWRAFKWWNVSPAANVGIIHRRVPTTFWSKFKNRLLWFPTKRIYLQASSISDNDLKQFVADINRKKTVWLQGYVGGLERVADYVLQNNIQINSLRLVWSTSAPLHKNVRLKMEKAFHCKIMNQYGSNEIANIAIQCPDCENLHINSDYVHVDIANDGEILVTNLYSYTFPLIKYYLGDKGKKISKKCSCGVILPLIEEVKGRISDAIYTPDGLYIDGNYLNSIFDNYTVFINQFQVYQSTDYSITVYIKPYNKNNETLKAIGNVKKTIENNVQNKIPVTIEIVDHISDDRGKIRYIISEIALSKMQPT